MGRPFLRLALFEGFVVSLGAAIGIFSTPRSSPVVESFPLVVMSSTISAFAWLVAFGIVGWLGWCIHMPRPKPATLFVWSIVLAGMLLWRPLVFVAGAIWPGAMLLALASIASAFLVPLLAAFSLSASWVCMPLLFWLGYQAMAVIDLAIHS